MGTELQLNLKQRAKELLQTDKECSLYELAELLRQYRNDSHPDKFQDQELKAKAETRFIAIQSLLEECDKQMEVDRIEQKPSELALFRTLYDAAQLQSEMDKVKGELKETLDDLKRARDNCDDLESQLKHKNDDSLNTEIQYLQSLYRPSTRNYASIGLAIILTGALGIMAQMERVSSILEKYSPFGKEVISTGLFICLLFFLATMLRKMWEREFIKRKSEEVCSPLYVGRFMDYLKWQRSYSDSITEFSELEAFDFIFGKKHRLKSIIDACGFQIYRPETANLLKGIFIHNLLNKKLAEIAGAENMQRYFKVVSARPNFWYHKYLDEKKKNESTLVAKKDE